jgi:LmbE family N-acetylglucosaminyl deacetylase
VAVVVVVSGRRLTKAANAWCDRNATSRQLDEAREALLQAGADAADAKRVTLLDSQVLTTNRRLVY